MKRMLMAFLLVGLLGSLNYSQAQVGTKDAKVRYRIKDSGKEDEVLGIIQDESLEGISIKPSKGGVKRIAAEAIIDVEYPAPNFESSQMLRKALAAEKGRKLEEAIGQYQKMKTLVTRSSSSTASPVDKKFSRHVEYKIALLTSKLDDQVKPAIALLEKYLEKNPDSWQVVNFPKLLVPLQLQVKDLDGAQKTLDTIAGSKRLPDGLRQELNMMAIKILLESRKYTEAEKKLADMIAKASDETVKLRLRVMLAETYAANKKFPQAKSELQDVIGKVKDNDMKAAAFNTLGECCENNNELRDAMWNFLYVDVLYNQNKDEHVRAMKNLARVFNSLKDNKRAKQYADMLKK